jgi:hypothetical protein
MSKSLHQILRDSVVLNGVQEVADIAPLTISTSVSDMVAFDRVYVANLVLGLDVSVTYRSDKELDSMIDKACHHFTDVINSNTKREISKLIAKMEFDYRAKDYAEELKAIYEKL